MATPACFNIPANEIMQPLKNIAGVLHRTPFYWTSMSLARLIDAQNAAPTSKSPRHRRGDYRALVAAALFQNHQRERIDVGLQCHQHADEAGQHDRVQEYVTKDRA